MVCKSVVEGMAHEKVANWIWPRSQISKLPDVGFMAVMIWTSTISFLKPKSALSKIVPCCSNCVNRAMLFWVPYVSMYGRFKSSMK